MATVNEPANVVRDADLQVQLSFLRNPIVEVRGIQLTGGIVCGVFDNMDSAECARQIAQAIEGWATAANWFLTINKLGSMPVTNSLQLVSTSAKDQHIVRRTILPIDIDPNRPRGVAATTVEHDSAKAVAEQVVDYLATRGFADPLVVDSGNGFQIFYHIDAPVDTDMVKQVLKALDAEFSNDLVKIDTAVSNASRIMRAAGTTNRKGTDTEERPHRQAKIIRDLGVGHSPTNATHVTTDHLGAIAAQADTASNLAGSSQPVEGIDCATARKICQHINYDRFGDRNDWIRLAGALKHQSQLDPDGDWFGLFDEISAEAPSYEGTADCLYHWNTMRNDRSPVATFRNAIFPWAIEDDPSFDATKYVDLSTIIGSDDGRKVVVQTVNEHEANNDVLSALATHPAVFTRNGQLVTVCSRPDVGCGSPKAIQIRPIDRYEMRHFASESCEFFSKKIVNGEIKYQPSSIRNAIQNAVFSMGGSSELIKPIEGIVHGPTLRRDGSLLNTCGYDAETGLYMAPGSSVVGIDESPNKDAANAALEDLLDLVTDFPFENEGYRSAFVCAVLTLLVRHVISGCTPLFTVDANCPGTGKGLLCEVIGVISTGSPMPLTPYVSDDDEMRKRLTTYIANGEPALLLDNVNDPIGGQAIDAAITSNIYSDRLLGRSEKVTVLNRTVIFATGNNISFGIGDTARRNCPIRLVTDHEKPELRTNFKYRLHGANSHVTTNRSRYLRDGLTILMAYNEAGRPRQCNSLGSFEEWSDLIPSALIWAGGSDPIENTMTMRAEEDQESVALANMLEGLESQFGSEKFTSAAVVEAVWNDFENHNLKLQSGLEVICGDARSAQSVGRSFSRCKSRVMNGRRLERLRPTNGITNWRITKVGLED